MGWESRPGGSYFYKSSRIGGKFVKTYFGRGEVALQAERLDNEVRREKQAEATALRVELDRLGPAEQAMVDMDLACRRMIGATLLSSGYYQHCRSWRKRHAIQRRH